MPRTCAAVGIDCQWRADPFPAIWEKYLFIAAFGMVTVYKNQTLGELLADEGTKELLTSIMMEIHTIATTKGVRLPEDIVEQTFARAAHFPFETKTSYQRDVEHKGRVNESDIYGEAIVRMGKALGVPTPVTRSIQRQIELRLSKEMFNHG